MDTVKILGGGISGLTAAINLRKAGLSVEVYEKKSCCGKHCNDFQFLENWTYDEHVLDFLKKVNIDADFYIKPYHSIEIVTQSLRSYVGKSEKPFMYLVKRGSSKDSIDRSLERQAKKHRVKIFYNSELKLADADIVATGPRKPGTLVKGIKFKFKHPDRSIVLFDNNVSQGSYSYFIVNDNMAEIACPNRIGTDNIDERFDRCVKFFENFLNMKIGKIEEHFSATANFIYTDSARIGSQYYVGEAAGFQDRFLGFGILYAMKSGYLAAQSIIKNLDYDELWKKSFQEQMRISLENKKIYRSISNTSFENLIRIMNSKNPIVKKLRGEDDVQSIMKKIYNGYLLGSRRVLLKKLV
jgi:flavin-dependent dehydrogenase